jgi:hypothetical protein
MGSKPLNKLAERKTFTRSNHLEIILPYRKHMAIPITTGIDDVVDELCKRIAL